MEDEMVEHVACMEWMREAHKIVVGKPEGKRPLGRLGIDGWIILQAY
jgi:hypothetical protein